MAQAGVHGKLDDDAMVGGTPSFDMRVYRRAAAAVPRLPEILRRLRALEEKFERDEGSE